MSIDRTYMLSCSNFEFLNTHSKYCATVQLTFTEVSCIERFNSRLPCPFLISSAIFLFNWGLLLLQSINLEAIKIARDEGNVSQTVMCCD